MSMCGALLIFFRPGIMVLAVNTNCQGAESTAVISRCHDMFSYGYCWGYIGISEEGDSPMRIEVVPEKHTFHSVVDRDYCFQ